MKNIVLSAVAVFAMSSFAMAGGDIAPVEEPVVEVPEAAPEAWTPHFYVGAAYVNVSASLEEAGSPDVDLTADNYALAAGMVINSYLAVEGRYSNSFSDATLELDSIDIDLPGGEAEVFAIFAKPMYAVTDQFIVYGLLGYASVSVSDDDISNYMDEDGFAYGAGAAFAVNANVLVFADWTRLYDDTVQDTAAALDGVDVTVDTFNVGVAYVF